MMTTNASMTSKSVRRAQLCV